MLYFVHNVAKTQALERCQTDPVPLAQALELAVAGGVIAADILGHGPAIGQQYPLRPLEGIALQRRLDAHQAAPGLAMAGAHVHPQEVAGIGVAQVEQQAFMQAQHEQGGEFEAGGQRQAVAGHGLHRRPLPGAQCLAPAVGVLDQAPPGLRMAGAGRLPPPAQGFQPGFEQGRRPRLAPPDQLPGHYMEHFAMVSQRVARRERTPVRECFECHRTSAWNDIRGVGFYKHH